VHEVIIYCFVALEYKTECDFEDDAVENKKA